MYNANHNPIIFPLLAHELIKQHGVIIKGRRRSDFKLAELLLTADENDLPDAMLYKPELKEWISICESEFRILVMDDVICYYNRQTMLKEANKMMLFHNIYSSAELGRY